MAKSPPALVEPSVLIWARKSIGLSIDETAAKLELESRTITAWESGEEQPTLSQLRELSGVYKRPLAVFFLAEPPGDFDALRDFRRLPNEERHDFGPELRVEIRRAYEQRETALELLSELGEEPQEFRYHAKLAEDIGTVAARVREILGVSIEQQWAWRSDYESLHGWIAAAENAGILVIQTSGVSVAQMRGFAISAGQLPVIGLNGKDAPYGRIFSLVHEFVHLMLNVSAVSNLKEAPHPHTDEERIEIYCNAVAAEALVPSHSIGADTIAEARQGEDAFDDDRIAALSRRYSVSREVIWRRLATIGRISARLHEQKRALLIPQYGKGGGFLIYHKKMVRNLGEHFVKLALQAYYNEVITASDLSGYLRVKFEHVPKIEQEILMSRGRQGIA